MTSATERPTASPGAAFGLVWWIVAFIILFQDGPGRAVEWLCIPFVVIAAHELGHLAAAWVARMPMVGTVVCIGSGLNVGVGGGRVRLGLLPGGGRVALAAPPRRWQRVVFAFGGIVGNLMLTLGLALVASRMDDTPAWIGLGALGSLVTAVVNVIPIKARTWGRTDGYEAVAALLNR